MNLSNPTLVFSAWNSALDTQANRRHVAWIKAQLRHAGIPYATAQGSYKGQTEPALIVQDTATARDTVQHLCRLLKQESILAIDANRAARLETCDGNLIETLGTFRNVPEQVARERDAWTRVDNQFYITVNFGV